MQLPRLTLSRWVELDADWLRPDYESIVTGVLSGGYMQTTRTYSNLEALRDLIKQKRVEAEQDLRCW